MEFNPRRKRKTFFNDARQQRRQPSSHSSHSILHRGGARHLIQNMLSLLAALTAHLCFTLLTLSISFFKCNYNSVTAISPPFSAANTQIKMKYYIATFLIVSSLLATQSSAFSVGSSMSSGFAGSVLITGKDSMVSRGAGATIEMKKGKDNVPPAMRAQYKRQREMSNMREQMMDAQKPGPDGLPVFNLYVRSPRANVSSFECHFVDQFPVA